MHSESFPSKKSEFSSWLIRHNNLDSLFFKRWFFKPGMNYLDQDKWWIAPGNRTSPHEGIDFCCFQDGEEQICYLPSTIHVPAMYDGTVVAIFPDFLGKSILLRHVFSEQGWFLHSLYGHTLPEENLDIGTCVRGGEIIASVAPPASRVVVPPHLHLSVLWMDVACQAEEKISWQTISNTQAVRLCDPLEFFALEE